MALHSLTLYDYSDRELLHIVHEVAEENGGSASSLDIAVALGIDAKRKTQSVGSRMAALRRYEAVENVSERGIAMWRLTPVGEVLAFGEPRAAQAKAIEGSKLEELLLLVRQMGERQRNAPATARHLLRREYQRSSGMVYPRRNSQ
jgi:hypothetical protein